MRSTASCLRSLLALTALAPAVVSAADSTPPTARLDAPASLLPGEALFLYGGRSTDTEGPIIQYWWMRTAGPAGATGLPLNQQIETADPVLTMRQLSTTLPPGLHRFQLQVIDAAGNRSSPAVADVRIIDNVAPVAVLDAPASVAEGSPIVLHGNRSSDIGGTVVKYRFRNVDGTVIETTSSRFTIGASLPEGVHGLQLVVVDDSGNESVPAQRRVRVIGPDREPPVAVLGAPATVGFGRSFELSAAGSKDARGKVVRYEWTRVAGIGGSLAPGKPVQTRAPTLRIDQPADNPMQPGRHDFRLVVVDDAGNRSQTAERSVMVAKPLANRR